MRLRNCKALLRYLYCFCFITNGDAEASVTELAMHGAITGALIGMRGT